MRLIVRGVELPGRRFSNGPKARDNVHVALQIDRDPVGLVAGDAPSAEWVVDLALTDRLGAPDFRGPAVHGRRGERFLYLTWGEVEGGSFTMFRRAKLMLADVPIPASEDEPVVATVRLTDECRMPRCARLRAPALSFGPARS